MILFSFPQNSTQQKKEWLLYNQKQAPRCVDVFSLFREMPLFFQDIGIFGGFFGFFLFIYFWLRWVFVAVRGLSLVAASGGYSSLQCTGFSLRWLLLLWSTGSRCAGFSSCGTWAQQLWCVGLVALWHVGSFWTRAGTHVPCIGRWILNHCATREVPNLCFFLKFPR